MYELIKISENDYYIDCPAKIGLCKISESEVVIIDSGNDKDAGKKVLRHIDENGWKLRAIYNTHSHADHTGGNKLLQDRTGCRVFARGLEAALTNDPVLEPMTLYGGKPFKELQNKFLMAQPSNAEPLTNENLPEGWELIELPGHSFDMVGFRTRDNNIFLADCLSSAETLAKYGISFLFDPEEYINTLEMVKTLEANMFIPAHAQASADVAGLAQLNIDAVRQTLDTIQELCAEKITFEDLLKKVFDRYELQMNVQQYALIGSTVRSYLSCLYKNGNVEITFENNYMYWKSVKPA